MADGARKVDDALLARDAADEQDVRNRRVHAIPLERVDRRVGAVEVGVDPVVDDVDSRGSTEKSRSTSSRVPRLTATTASADSMAVRSTHELTSYPPPSCSRFQGRSGSSEWTLSTSGIP